MNRIILFFVALFSVQVASGQTSCAAPVSITGLPTTDYTQGCLPSATLTDNTLSTVNGATNACGGAAREYWYTFTIPAGLPNYQIDLLNGSATRNVGFQLLNGETSCSATAWTGNVVNCQNVNGNGANETYTAMDMPAGTYYIRVVTYTNNNVDFTLCFTQIPDPPVNDNPCAAINVPVGTNGVCSVVVGTNAGATATAGPPAPGCGILSGGDVWYTITVPPSGEVTLATDYATTGSIINTDLAAYSGTCGALTLVGCDDATGNGSMASLSLTGQTPGATLWIRVWSNSNAEFGNFNLCFSEPPIPQTNQNCASSEQLCSDATINGASNGAGTVADLNAGNDGCLSGEHQTNWFYMNVNVAGSLAFTIAPSNGTDDYDFALWRFPGGTGVACPPAAAPIRCSFAAGAGLGGSYNTGLSAVAGDNSEGVFGDNWVQTSAASVGDIYILVVDNFSSTTSPFSLDFTGTAGFNCTPIPLANELILFTGEDFENGVELNWELAGNGNIASLMLQKLVDGEWMTIYTQSVDELKSMKNSGRYFDTDKSFIHENTYRLVRVDIDEVPTALSTIVVQQKGDLLSLIAFPIPAEGSLNVNFNLKQEQDLVAKVLDAQGKVIQVVSIKGEKGTNGFVINTNEFNQGTYQLVLELESEVKRLMFTK